jgi:hypothetical protein
MNEREKRKTKYFEIILSAAVVLGIAVISYTFKEFTDKIEHIEMTIAKHHGPEWKKIEKVIAITNLKNETNNKIRKLEESIEKLTKIEKALCCWSKQGDRIMMEFQKRNYDCYAHVNTKDKSDKKMAYINAANIYGRSFEAGDEVEIKNMDSGINETVVAKIISTYLDLEHSDVLIQLNKEAAEVINFSKERGKIKVRVSPKKISPEKAWKTVNDLIEEQKIS